MYWLLGIRNILKYFKQNHYFYKLELYFGTHMIYQWGPLKIIKKQTWQHI